MNINYIQGKNVYQQHLFFSLPSLFITFLLRDTASRKGTLCPFCVLIHKKYKIYYINIISKTKGSIEPFWYKYSIYLLLTHEHNIGPLDSLIDHSGINVDHVEAHIIDFTLSRPIQ